MKLFISLLFSLMCAITATAQQPNVKAQGKVVVDGVYYYVHAVQQGETLYSLSRTYGVTQDEIVKNNPAAAEGLKSGYVIKVPVTEEKQTESLFNKITNTVSKKNNEHTVNKGETAYSIAKRYAITIDNLIESNPGFDPNNIKIGQVILIPKRYVGSATQSEVTETFLEYNKNLGQLSPEFKFHLVEKGETLYSLSKAFNVSIETLNEYNPETLKDGLKLGSTLKIPIASIGNEEPTVEVERPKVKVRFGYDATPKKVDTQRPMKVMMMLPFTNSTGSRNQSFTEFYNGALIALRELKREGVSVDMTVVNTERSASKVEEIVRSKDFENADLIIGPVYNEQFAIVADAAAKNRIPVVSPLGAVDADNRFVYQVAPRSENRNEKLRQMFNPERNTIVITTGRQEDDEFQREIEQIAPKNTHYLKYYDRMPASSIESLLKSDRMNIVVVATDSENIAEYILANISSIQNAAITRTGNAYVLEVMGTPRWAKFSNNMDKQLFFKLNVSYSTSYHADRGNAGVMRFSNDYISTFGNAPSLYSYRGYDIARLFIGSLGRRGENFSKELELQNTMLQMPYRFTSRDSDKWINDQWGLVKYGSDYTITVR